jgi:hypothetical protein
MTVAENIAFALHMVNIAKPDIDLMVRNILEDTQLPDRINHYPDERTLPRIPARSPCDLKRFAWSPNWMLPPEKPGSVAA